MKFLQPMRRTVLSITLAVLLSVFGSWFILGGGTTKIDTVSANSTQNLSGWAWSGYDDGSGNKVGVGWISFNCTNPGENCGTSDYGVTISPLAGTGNFSGYAWARNIGWISFNSGETASCGGGAQINWASGAVTGWAKALAATGSGNWDGCISLSGATYGVTLGGVNFSGYAWGGNEVVGWIDWNPAGGGVKFTAPPQCSDGIDNDGNGLTDFPNDPGCTSASDPTESNTLPQCSDWVDNDGDGKIDIADPQCHTDGNAGNSSSYNPNGPSEATPPECSDLIDNNANGLIDAADPACHTDGNPGNSSSYSPNRKERTFQFKEF